MQLDQLTDEIKKVADQYAHEFGITYTDDWFLLKLQEEIGELTQQHLISTGRTRRKPDAESKNRLADEVADVFSYVLLLANKLDVNLEQAVERKWLKYVR